MDCKVTAAIPWLFAALTLSLLAPAANGRECLTPDKKIGDCINIKVCSSLMGRLLGALRLADRQFLRSSQCGWEDGWKIPKVCCVRGQNLSERHPPEMVNATSTRPSASLGGTAAGGQPPQQQQLPEVDQTTAEYGELLPKKCGRDLSNRIVGGSSLELDEHPWMALLEYRTPAGVRTACGGSLISKRYVLTAAHCLLGLPGSWRLESVRLGEYNTSSERDCVPSGADGSQECVPPDWPQSVAVERQIAHEQYAPTPQSPLHDIALLRLGRDVIFDNYASPICLPGDPVLKQRLLVAGWGTTESGHASDVKLKVLVPRVEPKDCSAAYNNRIRLGDGQICAGGDKGRDSCKGDSGGPLMQPDHAADGTPTWKIVGVVSFGPVPCGQFAQPGVYTKVYSYMPWIKSNLRP